MWSLFPPTSSSNLNNNVYLPHPTPARPATPPGPPPGFGGPGSGERCKNGPACGGGWRGVRPESPGVSPAALRSCPALQRSRSRPRPPEGLSPGGKRARGRGMGAGWAPRCPRAGRCFPGHPGPPPEPPDPAPDPAPPRLTRPALPRVRSSGTFSSPLSFRPARNKTHTHTQTPQLGSIAGRRRPGPSSSPTLLTPRPRGAGPSTAAAAATESAERGSEGSEGGEGGGGLYLVFGGSSESGRGRSPPY